MVVGFEKTAVAGSHSEISRVGFGQDPPSPPPPLPESHPQKKNSPADCKHRYQSLHDGFSFLCIAG